MICAQPGHLTHSPSGTRLAFSPLAAIGFRVFLNQAMKGSAYHSLRPRYVVTRARGHLLNLPDEVVHGILADVPVELRGLDDEERRGVVMEEEVMIGLVQFLQIVGIWLEPVAFGIPAAGLEPPQEDVGGRLQIEDKIG